MGIDDEARRSVDPDTLLPSEDSDSTLPGDAEHWIHVYEELRSVKVQLIAQLQHLMVAQGQEARDELERADLNILRAQVNRFERRLEFWRARLNSEGAGNISPPRSAGGQGGTWP